MKFWLLLLGASAAILLPFCCSSCAYSIPNGGQAVINDVTDAVQSVVTPTGLAAAPSSMNQAQARANQAAAFYGRAN